MDKDSKSNRKSGGGDQTNRRSSASKNEEEIKTNVTSTTTTTQSRIEQQQQSSSRSNSSTTLLQTTSTSDPLSSSSRQPVAAATRQLGGKGTVRRKVRKNVSHHLIDTSASSEHMRAFLSRFDFSDCGHVDRVSFFDDAGRVTSYDRPKLMANTKSHFYCFHVPQGNVFFQIKGIYQSSCSLTKHFSII